MLFMADQALTTASWAMRTANSGDPIRILALENSCIGQYITASFFVAESRKFSFCSSNLISNNTPNAIGKRSNAMIRAVSDSIQYTAISLLTIRTIVHLSGVLKCYTVTGIFRPNTQYNIY